MASAPVGEQELALLHHLAERGAASVGEVAETFGRERGWARSTVLTMMERLRRKGLLTRRVIDGVYRYRAKSSAAALLTGAVRRFVERHLAGSVSPVVAYLTEATDVSDEDLKELKAIVRRLEAERRES
jgi:predicted transcriptional regulator